MSKNFVHQTFERWIHKNKTRFSHRPRIFYQRKEFFILQFDGITKKLLVFISKLGHVEIRIVHQGDLWDILTDFDIVERLTFNGEYYCNLCIPHADIFLSREELWIAHSFEPLLDWTNKHFDGLQWLCLFAIGHNSTWAEINSLGAVEIKKTLKEFVYACPLVQSINLSKL